MSEEKVGFGYQDDESEDLKSKGTGNYGKFGLNTQAFITKFEYNSKAGKDGSDGDAIDITVKVGEKDYMQRIFAPDKMYDKDGNEITDKSSEEYIKRFNETMKQLKGVITHYLKCFRTEEELKKAFSKPINSFSDYAKLVTLLMSGGIVSNKPIDIFLQYQWEIKSGQDKTYLELPKNMKDGAFVTPSVTPVGEWEEIRDAEGLKYVDSVTKTEHRFTRTKGYLETNKAVQQKILTESDSKFTPKGSSATASSWGE